MCRPNSRPRRTTSPSSRSPPRAAGRFQWRGRAILDGGQGLPAGSHRRGSGHRQYSAFRPGRGRFLNLPKLEWPGFKSYEPSISSENADPLGLSGTKVFEQVIIPENDTLTEVPKIELAYFNPEEEEYQTMSQGPFPLKVNPSARPVSIPTANTSQSGDSGAEDAPQRSDIVWIKYDLGTLGQATPLVSHPTFWLLQSIPFLLWIGALVWRRKSEAIAGNPRLLRKRQVNQRTREVWAGSSSWPMKPRAGILHRVGGVAPPTAWPAPRHPRGRHYGRRGRRALGQAQIEPDTRDTLRRLFTASDAASYAASQSTAELRASLADLEQVIHELN